MPFQANHTLRANLCIVNNVGRQVEPITCFQANLPAFIRQAKGNRAIGYVDYLVIAVGVGRIGIARTV